VPAGHHGASTRWVQGYARVAELAGQLAPTRLVYVGDRESDMLELMVQAHDSDYAADYLLRSQHDRVLPQGEKLWAQVRATDVLGELRFVLPPTKQRPPKQAPKLNTVIRLIAGLGGFLGRKCDGEPGMQTLWLGLERVRDFANDFRMHPPELSMTLNRVA
jgi:hypothetical protein